MKIKDMTLEDFYAVCGKHECCEGCELAVPGWYNECLYVNAHVPPIDEESLEIEVDAP